MQYGICNLSVISVRRQADDLSEMTTQLLYGETFKVLEQRKFWSRIRVSFDGAEGWVSNIQYQEIEEAIYQQLVAKSAAYSTDLVSYISATDNSLTPIVLGSNICNAPLMKHVFEGNTIAESKNKTHFLNTSLLYNNAPFLQGGKTPFGIDAAGLTQMVYKINGHQLGRTALEQSKQGEALSFIEECEPGDLAFFDNNEGIIDHVGIIMPNNYIIHTNGKVRIDRIDHTGIFNSDTRSYSHSLRVIKKIIA